MATIPTPSTQSASSVVTSTLLNNHRDALQYLLGSSMTGGGGRRPLFIASKSANQSIATGTAYVPVTFTSEDVDYDSGHSTSSNTSRYTAATAGYYHVSATGTYAANATGVRGIHITVNAADPTGHIGTILTAVGSSTTTAITASGLVYLNVGDYVEMNAQQTSGGALNLTDARFMVRWVSN
jgi:hypothetical protein